MECPIGRGGLDVGGVSLRGRCALVTGAGTGISRAYAFRLAASGTEVTMLNLDCAAARRTAQEARGPIIQAAPSDPAVVDLISLDADIVVNNAALRAVAPVQELPPERFAPMRRVRLEGPFRIVPAAVRRMDQRGSVPIRPRVHGISEDKVVRHCTLNEPVTKRLLSTDGVAAYLRWLQASFINATSIATDDGWTAR
jgi:NAD(P)-dependent dehydrogenase (short-subunit alcohol dehydrogenase family)